MEIYMMRHGDAEPRASGLDDADRKLTPKGKRDTERVARLVKAMNIEPGVILTSPYRRAVETATIALKYLNAGKLLETSALLPQGELAQVWKEIRSQAKAAQVLIVGHEPQLSELIAFLLGCPELRLDLKKSALVFVDMGKITSSPKGELKWMLTPGLVRAHKKSVK